ncbi:MAG TPA: non-homologous end-joining DNA ligase [Minicystis sp.]|nr:non-homologous end-joining DNA ligase [Minicystis sp.]
MSRAARLSEAARAPYVARAEPTAPVAAFDVDGRRVELTHPGRVLYPGTGFTKADLAAYYLDVAPWLLPHLRDRPLTLGRFPGGVDGRGFAQAELPGAAAWMRTVTLALKNGKTRRFSLVDDRAGLAFLAQMGVLELHVFLGHPRALDRAAAIVFDLDPGEGASILEAAKVALLVRDRLAARGLAAVPKTSGSVGVHVLAPLAEPRPYADTRALANDVAAELAAAHPELVVDRTPRALRRGKVLVDARQNAERLTLAAPYTLRATPRPSASTPVAWGELEAAVAAGDADALAFAPADVLARLATRGDLAATLISLP